MTDKSVPSKIVSSRNGSKPLFERTDGEKIRICKAFLTARGYIVASDLLTKKELADYLKVSQGHIANLMENDSFPKPFDVGSKRGTIDANFKRFRWKTSDIIKWLENV